MLIKTTQKCGAGCSHCLENATPAGEHMTWATFADAIEFTKRIEADFRAAGGSSEILLSGGECTEHPDIVRMIAAVFAAGLQPMVLSNGLWMADPVLRKSLLRPEWASLIFQITYDPRFYPKPLQVVVDDPRIHYVAGLTRLLPLGRITGKKGPHPIPNKQYPSSFNLRSLVHSFGSFSKAVSMIRGRAASGLSGHCIPSVSHDGTVVAGESNLCYPVGTVLSSDAELTKNVLNMGSCNRCGLETNLNEQHRQAIKLP